MTWADLWALDRSRRFAAKSHERSLELRRSIWTRRTREPSQPTNHTRKDTPQ